MASWFLVFAVFIIFLPYNRKTGRKPTNMYLAFIVASALEMFGIPLSMYFVAWALGARARGPYAYAQIIREETFIPGCMLIEKKSDLKV